MGEESQRRVVQASEILGKIERDEDVEYDGVIIEGDLDISDLNLPSNHVDQSELDMLLGFPTEQKIIISAIAIINSEMLGEVDFSCAHLHHGISFIGTKFTGPVNFEWVEFGWNANFQHAKFASNVNFTDVQFVQVSHFLACDFGRARFDGYTDFSRAEFIGNTDFGEAEFGDLTFFCDAKFKGDANFGGAKFIKHAEFQKTKFTGDVNFCRAKFIGPADFSEDEFDEHADFMIARFERLATFKRAKFNGSASFDEAKFEDLAYFENYQFLKDVSFINTVFFSHLSQANTCRIAKKKSEEQGDKYISDYYFYKEMEAVRILNGIRGIEQEACDPPGTIRERLSRFRSKIIRILSTIKRFIIYDVVEYIFIQIVFGYGVRPFNVAIAWFIVVLVLGVVYWNGQGVTREGDVLEWYEYFYFSIVTAATPGYAGYAPTKGLYTLIAGSQAIFGTFMWAAFIATFARKWQR